MFVFLWVVLATFLAPFAVMLIKDRLVALQKSPPHGTESAEALETLEKQFGHAATARKEMIVVRCKAACRGAANGRSRRYLNMVEDKIMKFSHEYPGSILSVNSYFDYSDHHQGLFFTNPMQSHDRHSILFSWLWSVPVEFQTIAEDFTVQLQKYIDAEINTIEDRRTRGALELKVTGHITLAHAMKVSLLEFPLHEMRTLWLPLLILGIVLKSARLLLLALIPMLPEILVSIGIMYFVSLHMQVTYYGLMISMLLITALSWDYSLFTLTRYASERAGGADVEDAIVASIQHSGSIILVSGMVLTVCWSSMLGMPEMFKSFAVAASTAIITCVSAQITLVPSLLAIFPWLGPRASEQNSTSRRIAAGTVVAPFAADEFDDPSGGSGEHRLEQVHALTNSLSFTLGKFLTAWPINIIVVIAVYVTMMPFSRRFCANFDIRRLSFKGMGHSYEMTIPRGQDEWETAQQIQRNFTSSQGVLMPLTILATNVDAINESHKTLVDQEFFDSLCHMMNALVDATRGKPYALSASSFISPTLPRDDEDTGKVICKSYLDLQLYKSQAFAHRSWLLPLGALRQEFASHVQQMWNATVRRNAVLTAIFPRLDPFGPESFELVEEIRRILKKDKTINAQMVPGMENRVYGPAPVFMDLIRMTSSQLPLCFVVCVSICFSLIALWFGAAFIPVKQTLTVIIPISWTYGAALMVYEDGALAWLGIPGLAPMHGAGLDWTVPIFSLTFLVGLALDYDFFLFERVYEFRKQGFGDREAIQLGLSATGGVISAAGIILALTFVSLIFEAGTANMNQVGFVYVFSILIDTFVVRTMLVPALLSMSPRLNYWPTKMPTPLYEWLDRGADPSRDVTLHMRAPSEYPDEERGRLLR